MPKVNEYRDGVVGRLYKGLQGLVKSRNVTFVEGAGRLVGQAPTGPGLAQPPLRKGLIATADHAKSRITLGDVCDQFGRAIGGSVIEDQDL